MPDFDDLPFDDVTRAAADAAEEPDFAGLAAKGVRRRNRRRASYAGLAAVVVLSTIGAVQIAGNDPDSAPGPDPAPEPSPTGTTTPDIAPDAEAIVNDRDSRLVSLSISDDDPDRRATVWQQCTGSDGCESRYAIVVSKDGFEHRTVLPKVFRDYPLVAPAGDGFHLQNGLGAGTLISPGGSQRDVELRDEPLPDATGPVVSIGSGTRVWVTIDPETATAALVPGAEQFQQLSRQSDGSLAGIDNSGNYVWSVDGGTNWSERKLNGGPGALYQVVPTDGSQQVVLEGADGATLLPFVAAHRARSAGGVAFERLSMPDDPRAYVAGPVVLPDGRLLVGVEAWSDERRIGDPVTMPGLYVSEGSDWTSLRQVDVGAPYDELKIFQPSFLDTKVSEAGATIYLQAPPGESVDAYRSDDGGLTWQAVPAR